MAFSKFIIVGRIIKAFSTVFVWMLFSFSLTAGDKPDMLFLLGGQSNMLGAGYTEDLPDSEDYKKYLKPIKNALIWDHKNQQSGSPF